MIHPALDEIYSLWHKGLGYVADHHVYKFKDYSECIFDTQIRSKAWLCHSLNKVKDREIKHIEILAGWYGIVSIPMLMHQFGRDTKISIYDVDDCTHDICKFVFKNYENVNVYHKDVVFDNLELEGDTIINSSCEHMYDMADLVNANRGKLFVLQSNNNKNVKWLHINCVDNCQELIQQADIKNVLHEESVDIYNSKRIMVIGT